MSIKITNHLAILVYLMMALTITNHLSIQVALIAALLTAATVVSDDNTPVPGDKSQLQRWFKDTVKPYMVRKVDSLDAALVTAEDGAWILKVKQDGTGDFKTITDAINSIPADNSKRVIVYIGAGTYKEKIKIEKSKPFVTLYGDRCSMPELTYDGTAPEYGTVDSASLIVESDYFMAVNLIISNSAPKPDWKRLDGQALALRISGDKAAFYNCKLIGFQDTLCDDKGRHMFVDCTIEGTVDFIFGSGKSLYLNSQLKVVAEDGPAVIAAQARNSTSADTGYSFVYCDISGTASETYLGRAWTTSPIVVYAYTTMGGLISSAGWSDNSHPERASTVYFGEYRNSGAGADAKARANFTKQLSDSEAQAFISLGYIEASKWLLPPPCLKVASLII